MNKPRMSVFTENIRNQMFRNRPDVGNPAVSETLQDFAKVLH